MATSGKGGFRNNGQPRIQLKRGWTRVSQLKAALRELRKFALEDRAQEIITQALEGTYAGQYEQPLCPHGQKFFCADCRATTGKHPHEMRKGA